MLEWFAELKHHHCYGNPEGMSKANGEHNPH